MLVIHKPFETSSFVHQYDTRQAGEGDILMAHKNALQDLLETLVLNPAVKLP